MIKNYGEGEGNGIEAYKSSDPYTQNVDNRPIQNLVQNDIIINSQIQSMTPKYPLATEQPNGTRRVFTFPNEEKAVPGSLEVWMNGVKYNPLNITLISNGLQFEISGQDILPDAEDEFYFVYRILNEFDVISEVIEFEETDNYIGEVTGRNVIKGSVRISFDLVDLIKDDVNGDLIKISDNSFVGTVDYDTGEYDFTYAFAESGGAVESGVEIEFKYQNYKE